MVAKGNKDQHRYTYSSGVKAVEENKWGRATAERRYGPLQYKDGASPPPDRSYPQDPEAKPGSDWRDDSPNTWVRGFGKGGNESAEGKPNFQPGFKGKK